MKKRQEFKITGKLDFERLKTFLSVSQLDRVGVIRFPQNYIITVYRGRERQDNKLNTAPSSQQSHG